MRFNLDDRFKRKLINTFRIWYCILLSIYCLQKTTYIMQLSCFCRHRSFHAIIMGPPGSGKGTISSRIIKHFNFKHLSSGDLLRDEMSKETAQGLSAKEYILAGKLVPDLLVAELILTQLNQLNYQANWILDGFPRTVGQAELLTKQERIDNVINLDVPFATIRDRLSGRWTHLPSGRVYNNDFNPPKVAGFDDITGDRLVQREDDKPEVISQRLKAYEILTLPVLDFFRNRQVLSSFSGNKTDEIWPLLREHLTCVTAAAAQ